MKPLIAFSGGSPAAALLLTVIVLASLAGLFAPWLIERSLLRPYWLVRQRQYLTPVTSGFMHADLPHLVFNAFTFWAFAFPLEREIGSSTFLTLYAVGLLTSAAGTYVKHRKEPEYRSLGASGAILAVLFASIAYFPTQSIFILPIPVPIPAPLFAVAYLAFSYVAAQRARGRVNHDAHLAGALAGIAFVIVTDPAAFGHALHRVFG